MATTRLGLYGGPRQLWGTFSGKTEAIGGPKATDQITRLGLYGGPRFLYGTFSGKAVIEAVARSTGSMLASQIVRRRMRRR